MGGNDKVVQRMDNFFEKVRGWALPNFTVENEPDFCAPYAFFFQAEDGIRHGRVTGVQTCALPILPMQRVGVPMQRVGVPMQRVILAMSTAIVEIGRASCRERAEIGEVAVGIE